MEFDKTVLIVNNEIPLLKKCHLIFNIFEKDSHFKTIAYPS
jgi:hypothetical protein